MLLTGMQNNFLSLLRELINIQSVSADPKRVEFIIKAAELISKKLKSLGFDIKIYRRGNFPPLIIAQKIISPQQKTIGFYSHYDVQPEDPIDEWNTSPFELIEKNGQLYGRGVADDKGHLAAIISAIEDLIKNNKLVNNIVLVIEGEEEIGSMNFETYIKQANILLKDIDVFYVLDVGMHGRNLPQIFYGLRGLVYYEIEVEIGKLDLHSGIYGNRVYNPIQVLSELFSKLKSSKTGRIMIPGFYNKVKKITKKERELLKEADRTDKDEAKEAGTYTVIAIDAKQHSLSTKLYPSFDVHGIVSGYTGEGSKTVIPKKAKAKFSFRLVEYQDPDLISQSVRKFIKKNIPKGVKWELKLFSQCSPFYTDFDNEYVLKVSEIMKKKYGNKTLLNRAGGSIPAAEVLKRIFDKPIILYGFTLPESANHAPNENISKEMFIKGMEAIKEICSI